MRIWQKTKIASDQTYHLFNNIPLYSKRFVKVLKYHAPGLAPVIDEEGAYHINIDGNAIYLKRFDRTFGYYQQRAAVIDGANWFHIMPNGKELYKEKYQWCGNYQDSYCAVCDFTGSYFHIDLQGKKIYKERYKYAGDFKDSIAVVQDNKNLYTHIDHDGNKIHNQYFIDLDIFHKDFARAKDLDGWFHIDKHGKAIYQDRYKMIEPFYNGYARVLDFNDAIIIINEEGEIVRTLKPATRTDLQNLSGDLVGYWKTQAIKAAVELKIFDYLPNTEKDLNKKIILPSDNLIRLLRALAELKLIFEKDGMWCLTSKGNLLRTDNDYSLAKAALHWGYEHYLCWMDLKKSLQINQENYSKNFGATLFDWLDKNINNLQRYQQAMHTYAYHDYQNITAAIGFNKHKTVIDAAGGQGTLLQFILHEHQHLHGILLERPKVIDNIVIPKDLRHRLEMVGFDLFAPWPKKADAIFLSRVLHDWNDKLAIKILQYARNSLQKSGTIYLIEMLLQEDSYNGSLLDLNMLVITGGKERTIAGFNQLLRSLNLKIVSTHKLNNVASIIMIKEK